MSRTGVMVLVVLASLASTVVAAPPVTTESLMAEMVDLRVLAEFPDPAFKTVQFSSYDRRSNLPGGPGWFSNADGFGNEPIPAFEAVLKEPGEDGIGEYLICDVQAPGAIVRCWTAAISGQIRMWLDDAAEPVFDGSADDFLRRPYNVLGERVGLDPAVFEGTFNQQNATYCPIPFAKRCRIVWTGDIRQVHFYEVQVRVYEPGAAVKTFAPQDLENAGKTIARVAERLAAPGDSMSVSGSPRSATASVAPGASADLLVDEQGPAAIELLAMQVTAADVVLALRQTVLHISFDGAPRAQVECPIGDFFGAAPGVNPFDSVPFTVKSDGIQTCRFVMPYAKSMRIRVENLGAQPVEVSCSGKIGRYEWNDDRSMHFCARWRVDHGITADPRAPQDIPFLVAQGQGRYVGTASIMLNPTDIPTPGGGWWGEGDEKIFVDDDGRPSTFGTGSEDYYNYAWSIPDIFGFAYCGQPRNDGPGNRGFVTNHRWHVLDSLPFGERMAFYMELWPHARTPGFSYARIAYHYARPGLIDDSLPITTEDVRPLDLPVNWQPRAEGGARNSVFMQAEEALSGDASGAALELVEGNLFAGSRALQWKPGAVGSKLDFGFSVAEAGWYAVDLCTLRSGASGKVRLWLDGAAQPYAEADLNAPARTMLRRLETEAQELNAGEHTLHVEFTGEVGQVIGVDFLWIQRRER
ncbi:MAG: DUF2961 domain-containing protein [Leptolyngbya sp. PLA3]|nr:MAG: DUF2961 domain-containing protein [Cyanobacteria bacterium CYA]MCE7969609.1 DUF2961 domain-containing protein [Leptolyngbya sp. PL-A3]